MKIKHNVYILKNDIQIKYNVIHTKMWEAIGGKTF